MEDGGNECGFGHMELEDSQQLGKDTTGWLMRDDVQHGNRTWLVSPFPILRRYISHGEELAERSFLQWSLFGFQQGAAKKRWFRRTWLSVCFKPKVSRSFCHRCGIQPHCLLWWSTDLAQEESDKQNVTETNHLSSRISGLYFVWLRMEIPLLFQANLRMHQIQRWGFNKNLEKKNSEITVI